MRLQIPTIYNDEHIYSIIQRIFAQNLFCSPYDFSTSVFKKEIKMSFQFTKNLKYITDVIGNDKFTTEYLIRNHTVIPFFEPFVSKNTKTTIYKDMSSGSRKGTILTLLGRSVMKSYDFKTIKICPKCYEEEKEKSGEPYIHRRHQINGYVFCPKHNIPLDIYKTDKFETIKYHSIEWILNNCPKIPNPLEITNNLRSYIQEIDYIMDNHLSKLDIEKIKILYLEKLKERQLLSLDGKLFFRKLSTEIKNEFGDLLSVLHIDNLNWLKTIIRPEKDADKNIVNPDLHIILILYLFGSCKELVQSIGFCFEPFGKSPHPCLNEFCKLYKKNTIEEYKLRISYKNKEKYYIGTFRCPECGYTYKRKGPDKTEEDRYKKSCVVDFGYVWKNRLVDGVVKLDLFMLSILAAYMDTTKGTIVRKCIEYNLTEYINTTVNRGRKKKERVSAAGIYLKDYKQKVTNIMLNNNIINRSILINLAEKEYYYINKYDKPWIDNLFKNVKSKHIRTFRKNLQRKYDAKDKVLLPKCSDIINQLIELSKYKNINLKYVSDMLGINPNNMYRKKYPLCYRFISDYKEKVKEVKLIPK